jgi:hypothetical protein
MRKKSLHQGLIFKKKDGEMDDLFKAQDWYQGCYTSVDDQLSELQKVNLKLMRQFEG